MTKTKLDREIILNFCTSDYKMCSTFVEEECEEAYSPVFKYCKKYELEVGSILPIYDGTHLIINAVVSKPNERSSKKILKEVLDKINSSKMISFFMPVVHIHQKVSKEILAMIRDELKDFKVLRYKY